MTEQTVTNGEKMADKEILSALFDGEKVDPALLNGLTDDQAARETWQCFSTTREILRGETAQQPQWDIAAKFQIALEEEAPHGTQTAPSQPQNTPDVTPEWITSPHQFKPRKPYRFGYSNSHNWESRQVWRWL